MRGRRPQRVRIARADRGLLEQLARRDEARWYEVRRARIVLAIASGARTQDVARQLDCDMATVRRTCRRYQAGGLGELLAAPPRSGRPEHISPPRARAAR
jgi:transposase